MDEIDVSKCENYYEREEVILDTGEIDVETICLDRECDCHDVTDCYYKQLQYWKHQAELGSETTDRLSKELDELKQENEKLKRECTNWQKHSNATYWQIADRLSEAEQKLEKIKFTCNFDIEHQGYATPTIDDILQIIEE